MSDNEELKWLTKRFAWRYIPFRFQPLVASIVAGLLIFNIFGVYFSPTDSGLRECGSLFRPVVTRSFSDSEIARRTVDDIFAGTNTAEETPSSVVGLPWDSLSAIFTLDDKNNCPKTMQVLWWEAFASFGGLALCGVVLRRAIKREQGSAAGSGGDQRQPRNNSRLDELQQLAALRDQGVLTIEEFEAQKRRLMSNE